MTPETYSKMIKYVTAQGDTVEYIAWKQYGTQGGRMTEKVLAANPGLAELGAELQAGVVIYLPDIETAATTQGVKLWS